MFIVVNVIEFNDFSCDRTRCFECKRTIYNKMIIDISHIPNNCEIRVVRGVFQLDLYRNCLI